MELTTLLPAFAQPDEANGLKLVQSLHTAAAFKALQADQLKTLFAKYSANVQASAEPLYAELNEDLQQQQQHLEQMLTELKDGDIRRGQAVFSSTKTACMTCHAIGYVGGKVGPDLTTIGQIRNQRDLLEAIIYPSASFVRSYEPVIIDTKDGEEYSGIVRKETPDEVVLVVGATTEQRVARNEITEMRPGKVSVMPSGFGENLTKQELADLVAFLKATKR